MPSLDELKDRIRAEASEHPERFFAVDAIKAAGFHRGECSNCGMTFWSVDEDREVCGEPDCSGGYTFINDPPTDKAFDVVSAWQAFASFMHDRGYEPIDRYPLAARWRNDTEVVRASIYDFQPYVVDGLVEPPANPLVVPQFCFRSNDIDNVGITGRHYTGFIMVGQHAFTEPDDYDQDKYFRDMLAWVTEGMGIPKEKVILHEDSWGGGGNLGACMEFFVDGLELFNQVYMFYEIDPDSEQGYRELDTKVLDMGMGHERIVWITHGSETSYEANMPQVVEKLYDATGVEPDKELWNAFLPYAGHLNLDEVDDIEATWQHIADEIGVETDRLKEEIMPAAALYAIADHTRCLLVALQDGLLPSNKGERHALRVMVRRCFSFIDQYDWDLDLTEVLEWHADEFGALYPGLRADLDGIKDIIRHEERKYRQMQEDAERIIADLDAVDTDTLIELYDSHGITPDMLQREGIDVEVPDDFYAQVTARHADEDTTETEDGGDDWIDVGDVPETERLYFQDEYLQDFEATVLAVVDDEYVVLNETAFYPTSGGQEHDTGVLGNAQVVDVIDQDGVILHRIDGPAPEEGDTVACSIDWERRSVLMKHHTATHIINGAAKQVLGDHVWQAGAHKSEEKARLDITHYETLDDATLQRIEDVANEIVEQDFAVEKEFLERTEAEQRYGFRIYQGGAVPGKEIRIVRIGDGDTVDVEACGGTHRRSTGEVGPIRVIGASKVQDGTIRLEYVAGPVAEEHDRVRDEIRDEIAEYVETDIPIEDIADVFSVEVKQLPRIVERFVDEWKERRDELQALRDRIDPDEPVIDRSYGERPRDPATLFDEWKQLEKDIETLQARLEDVIKEDVKASDSDFVTEQVDTEDVGMLIRIARHVTQEQPEKAVLLVGKNAVIGVSGDEHPRDMTDVVGEYAETVQGDADFAKGFQLKDDVSIPA